MHPYIVWLVIFYVIKWELERQERKRKKRKLGQKEGEKEGKERWREEILFQTISQLSQKKIISFGTWFSQAMGGMPPIQYIY